jgi:hypothetical protein
MLKLQHYCGVWHHHVEETSAFSATNAIASLFQTYRVFM